MSIYIYLGPRARVFTFEKCTRTTLCMYGGHKLPRHRIRRSKSPVPLYFLKGLQKYPETDRARNSMESFDGILHFLFSLLPNFQTVDSERQRVNPISFIVRSFGIKKEKLEDRRKYRRLKFLIIERSSLPLPRFEKEF